MATVKTGMLYFWSQHGSPVDLVKPVATYVLGRRETTIGAVDHFIQQGGIWSHYEPSRPKFTPWHEISSVTVQWEDETISETLADKLIAEGRLDVVKG